MVTLDDVRRLHRAEPFCPFFIRTPLRSYRVPHVERLAFFGGDGPLIVVGHGEEEISLIDLSEVIELVVDAGGPMAVLEEIRARKLARPFRPFTLRTPGKAFLVESADSLAIAPGGRALALGTPDGTFAIVDVVDVLSVEPV